ncbi:MAG: hypothetical protein WDM84_01530 [Bauldia sp.]
MPWNLKGVDAETREAITEAARLSGLPVAEWLKQVLGERYADPPAERQAQPDEAGAAADLARSMQALTERIAAMDQGSRTAISALPRRLDAIEQHIGRLAGAPRSKGERARLLGEATAMVTELAREIDNADEQARSMVEGLRGRAPAPRHLDSARVNEAIGELDRRVAAMQEQVAQQQPATPRALSLDEIRARLNTLLAETPAPAAKARRPAPKAPQTAVIDAALRALEDRLDTARAPPLRRA